MTKRKTKRKTKSKNKKKAVGLVRRIISKDDVTYNSLSLVDPTKYWSTS